MIAIIDYGLGNVCAFANVYSRLGIPFTVASRSSDLDKATKLILPGVGSFDHAMHEFEHSGMRDKVESLVLSGGIPILGVCVGMQMLAKVSEEGALPGLGWIEGEVIRFDSDKIGEVNNLPHMGWNDVRPIAPEKLFKGLEQGARFYFLHSYFFKCCDESNILAYTDYGEEFACAVNLGNLYGVQFHPEKSHHFGAQLLKNFSDI